MFHFGRVLMLDVYERLINSWSHSFKQHSELDAKTCPWKPCNRDPNIIIFMNELHISTPHKPPTNTVAFGFHLIPHPTHSDLEISERIISDALVYKYSLNISTISTAIHESLGPNAGRHHIWAYVRTLFLWKAEGYMGKDNGCFIGNTFFPTVMINISIAKSLDKTIWWKGEERRLSTHKASTSNLLYVPSVPQLQPCFLKTFSRLLAMDLLLLEYCHKGTYTFTSGSSFPGCTSQL